MNAPQPRARELLEWTSSPHLIALFLASRGLSLHTQGLGFSSELKVTPTQTLERSLCWILLGGSAILSSDFHFLSSAEPRAVLQFLLPPQPGSRPRHSRAHLVCLSPLRGQDAVLGPCFCFCSITCQPLFKSFFPNFLVVVAWGQGCQQLLGPDAHL